MMKFMLPALAFGALPMAPFAEQTAFQASEPTVIRINMDRPRHSSMNFLAVNPVMPKFSVKYDFASSKPDAQIGENEIALDKMESASFVESPKLGDVLRQKDDIVLNLIPPTENHDLAKREVEAAIAKSRAEFDLIKSKQFLEKGGVAKLKSRIRYGGQIARNALNSLINMMQYSEQKKAMISAGVPAACAELLKRESTPSDLRALSGSVITLLTDMPVASTVDDAATGSYAHVNIVLPSPARLYHADAEFAKIEAGAAPKQFLEDSVNLHVPEHGNVINQLFETSGRIEKFLKEGSHSFLQMKSIMNSMKSYEEIARTFSNAGGRSFAKPAKFDLFNHKPASDESRVNIVLRSEADEQVSALEKLRATELNRLHILQQ